MLLNQDLLSDLSVAICSSSMRVSLMRGLVRSHGMSVNTISLIVLCTKMLHPSKMTFVCIFMICILQLQFVIAFGCVALKVKCSKGTLYFIILEKEGTMDRYALKSIGQVLESKCSETLCQVLMEREFMSSLP